MNAFSAAVADVRILAGSETRACEFKREQTRAQLSKRGPDFGAEFCILYSSIEAVSINLRRHLMLFYIRMLN